MAIILILARIILFFVFITAGVTKLIDRKGSYQAIIDFGISEILASIIAIILPVGEIIIAFLMLSASTARAGAIGGLVLLMIFTVFIGINLSKGRTPDCHCFGQIHSEPVSWKTIARNAILAFLASFIIWKGAGLEVTLVVGSPKSWSPEIIQLLFLISSILFLSFTALEIWVVFNLVKQNGQILLRMEELENKVYRSGIGEEIHYPIAMKEGLPVGEKAPSIKLTALDGKFLTVEKLLPADKPSILVFTNPGCSPCNALLSHMKELEADIEDKLKLIVISQGTIEENRAKNRSLNLENFYIQDGQEALKSYRISATPSALLVLSDGKIGGEMAAGGDAIKTLIARFAKKV